MSSHLRHCPKHRKPLPCPHCALTAKPAPVAVAAIPEPMPVVETPVQKKRGRNTPDLPKPVMECAWTYTQTLKDGRHELKCSQCGDTQLVNDLLGTAETRVCRGIREDC